MTMGMITIEAKITALEKETQRLTLEILELRSQLRHIVEKVTTAGRALAMPYLGN